jgi:hypothetical protein
METKQVLIAVKAYPNPSSRYGETVCCAGIDMGTGEWIRLYPIPYRDLDTNQRFKKYSIIEVKCSKASDDKRPESYKIEFDSIKVLEWWDTKDKWERRKSAILPTLSRSMCDVYRLSEKVDLSLALVEPQGIDFSWEKAGKKDNDKRNRCYSQLGFFDKKKDAIEPIPFNFYYTFSCESEQGCTSHKLPIIDWEIGQAYRSWRIEYPNEKVLLEKIRERWLTLNCSSKNEVYLFVGNTKRWRDTFMVLGVFFPPKIK